MMGSIRDFFDLTKPRLTQLVVLTALCGFAVAPGEKSTSLFMALLLGSWGIVAAANIVNCYLERDIDGHMERTKNRALVTGKLKALPVLWIALLMASASVLIMHHFINELTAFLGFLGFILYVGVYTPVKRVSMSALFLGAIPGAIPPVMGWTAVDPTFQIGPVILFLILFFWQLPHFIAISVNRQSEYDLAGLKTVAGSLGRDWALKHMIFYSVLLILSTFLPYIFGLAGTAYLVTSMIIGIFFFWMCLASIFSLRPINWSRLIFLGSLFYLPIVLGVWVMEQWYQQWILKS